MTTRSGCAGIVVSPYLCSIVTGKAAADSDPLAADPPSVAVGAASGSVVAAARGSVADRVRRRRGVRRVGGPAGVVVAPAGPGHEQHGQRHHRRHRPSSGLLSSSAHPDIMLDRRYA